MNVFCSLSCVVLFSALFCLLVPSPLSWYCCSITHSPFRFSLSHILQSSYQRARDLLRTRSEQHHRLANALLEFETLSYNDMRAVLENKDLRPMKEEQKQREAKLMQQMDAKYRQASADDKYFDDDEDDGKMFGGADKKNGLPALGKQ